MGQWICNFVYMLFVCVELKEDIICFMNCVIVN